MKKLILLVLLLGCSQQEEEKPDPGKELQDLRFSNQIAVVEQLRKGGHYASAARQMELHLHRTKRPELVQPYLQLLYQARDADRLEAGLVMTGRIFPSLDREPMIHFYRADVAARKVGPDAALEALAKCLAIAPCEQLKLAALMRTDQVERTLSEVASYLKRKPGDAAIRQLFADYLLRMKRADPASAQIEALASGTHREETLAVLRVRLAEQRGDEKARLEAARRAFRHHPEDPEILFELYRATGERKPLEGVEAKAPPVSECRNIHRTIYPKPKAGQEIDLAELRQRCSGEFLALLARARAALGKRIAALEAARAADANARFKGMYEALWLETGLTR